MDVAGSKVVISPDSRNLGIKLQKTRRRKDFAKRMRRVYRRRLGGRIPKSVLVENRFPGPSELYRMSNLRMGCENAKLFYQKGWGRKFEVRPDGGLWGIVWGGQLFPLPNINHQGSCDGKIGYFAKRNCNWAKCKRPEMFPIKEEIGCAKNDLRR